MSGSGHTKGIWVMLNLLAWELRARRRAAVGRPLGRKRTLARIETWLPQLTLRVDGEYAVRDEELKLFPGDGRDALQMLRCWVTEDFSWYAALRMFERGDDVLDIYDLCEPVPKWTRAQREESLNARAAA